MQSVINSELDTDVFLKDFTEDRIIIQTEKRAAAGKQVDVIEEIPYRISLETNEIILDPENIKRIKGANDNPVAKQQREDLRFGKLSYNEMRLSGAKSNFGPEPRIKLSDNEMRYLSPDLAARLIAEKFRE